MNCCQCQGIEARFNQQVVTKKLNDYRQKGPPKTTRILIEALKGVGVKGMTLLDIGGGIGAIQYELLDGGVTNATSVEAASAYVEAAKAEAKRRGYAERVTHQFGNFTDLVAQIPPADIVTLDRVICCYHDMERLVELSAARAGKLYGLVYPRDIWWVKLGLAFENFTHRLQRSPFRVFAHPTEAVEAIVYASGLKRCFYQQAGEWQVVIYRR